MASDERKLQDRWKATAERASKEQDPQKLIELATELIDALRERAQALQPNSDAKLEAKDGKQVRGKSA